MSSFGRSFEQAFNPAFRQSWAAGAEADQQRMQSALMEQRVRNEMDLQRARRAEAVGLPANASESQIRAAEHAQSLAQTLAIDDAKAGAATKRGLSARGLSVGLQSQPQAMPGTQPLPQEAIQAMASLAGNAGMGMLDAPQAMAPQPSVVSGKTPEQQIAEYDQAQEVKQAADLSAARAKAADPYGDNYTQGDNYAVNGKFIGRAVRDKRTGEYGLRGADGKIQPLPDGAEPITATAMQKNVPSYDSFRKVTSDLTDSERALRQLDRYAKSVGGLRQGLEGVADGFTGVIKTLFNSGKLTQEELNRRIANGNLQGLLGSNRLAVVGGGVMTENDAIRIINNLGGDVGALQNKEQVMRALSQLYQDRYAQYQNDSMFYNAAVDDYYGAKGYKHKDIGAFNTLFGEPATGPSAGPAVAPAAPAVSNAFTEADAKRLQELRAKLK